MDVFYGFIFTLCLHSTNSLNSNDLYGHLTKDYRKQMVPGWEKEDPLYLTIVASPGSLNSFEETDETLSITMTLNFNWTDPRLTWEPTNYSNKYLITITTEDIWLPFIYLVNNAEGIHPIGIDSDSQFYAIISYNGHIYGGPAGVFKAKCPTDISKFPFDTQNCFLAFSMWGILPGTVRFNVLSEEPLMAYYYGNSDWTITRKKQLVYKLKEASIFSLELSIKRESLYYIITVALPTLMFCVMNPLVFFLPTESGERVSLGMTILLAYAIFITLVAESIPAKSNPICALILLLVLIMLISGLIVIFSIVSSHYYFKEDICGSKSCLKWISFSWKNKGKVKYKETESGTEYSELSGKDAANILDVIFMITSYVLFVVVICIYFIFVFSI